MNGAEFTASLKTLHWSRARFARIIGRHPNSISNWSVDGPPHYAVAYLKLALGVHALHEAMGKDYALVVSYQDGVYDPETMIKTVTYPVVAGTAPSNLDKKQIGTRYHFGDKKPA